jgi:hypothetical protein
MKIKHAINAHKGTTFLVMLGLMVAYQNFTFGPWVYLTLHGTYGGLWLLKDRIYPDNSGNKSCLYPWASLRSSSSGCIGWLR